MICQTGFTRAEFAAKKKITRMDEVIPWTELLAAIDDYIAANNQNPKPFVWTASPHLSK